MNGDDSEEQAYAAAGGAGRILYRAMREDHSGAPMIGPTARTLGVRPHVDVLLDAAGLIQPGTGGLSVAPDRPENLHPLRRPPAFGGTGKDPVWYINADLLPGDLQFRQDSLTHGLIEPRMPMSLADFQDALARTRTAWKKL
jgi:hypothetical protein